MFCTITCNNCKTCGDVLRLFCDHNSTVENFLVLYLAGPAVTNSAVSFPALVLLHTKSLCSCDMILYAFTAYNAPFYKQKQQLQTNWQCTIRRPCVFCSAKCNNCKRCCALPKWFCSHKANGCKLFGAVSCLLCSNCRLCTLLDGS